jgi:2-polyprenyl-3-methyl-5-hydroxy-6-metoxy-1,4-benzoquinol methylase
MSLKTAGGAQESGIVIGNAYDKYGSRNPIVKWMMSGFEAALSDLVSAARPSEIHEIGCGEGYWVLRWTERGLVAKGSDFSTQVIEIARENATAHGLPTHLFEVRSIYEVEAARDAADLIVCCEVMEHLEDPETALRCLQNVVRRHLIISVPREPIWRMLNLARGKYVSDGGNTPGHIQHWSRTGFVRLVSKYFEVVEVRNPLPWTMLLCRPRA